MLTVQPMKYCLAVCSYTLMWYQPYLSNYIRDRGSTEKAKVEETSMKPMPCAKLFIHLITRRFPSYVLPQCTPEGMETITPTDVLQNLRIWPVFSLWGQCSFSFTQLSILGGTDLAPASRSSHQGIKWEKPKAMCTRPFDLEMLPRKQQKHDAKM